MSPFTPPTTAFNGNTNEPPSPAFKNDLKQAAAAAFDKRWDTLTLALETITPVYGGGTMAGEVDMLVPFRPRAIKNAIRHWWWLINRHTYPDSTELYAEMGRLFGAACESDSGGPGLVQVRVSQPAPGEIANRVKRYFPWRPPRRGAHGNAWRPDTANAWAYALFPAKGEQRIERERDTWSTLLTQIDVANPNGLVPYSADLDLSAWFKSAPRPVIVAGLRFAVEVSMDCARLTKCESVQVIDAVRAWVSLGGIGARTHRGLGALKVCQCSAKGALVKAIAPTQGWPDIERFDKWLEEKIPEATCVIDDVAKPTAGIAWESALKRYRNFRQARQTRANNIPARSYWPKVDVVRQKGYLNDGHRPHHPAVSATKFPLPELFFGAPIEVGTQANKTTVAYEGAERFASPLILRPLCIAGQYHSAAIVLPFLSDVTDKSAKVGTSILTYAQWWYDTPNDVENMLKNPPPSRPDVQPGDPRGHLVSAAENATNPLDMFLNYFDEQRRADVAV